MGAFLQFYPSKEMLGGCLKTMRLKEVLNNLAFPGPYGLRLALTPVPGDRHQDMWKSKIMLKETSLRSLLKIQGGLLKILKARCQEQGLHPKYSS